MPRHLSADELRQAYLRFFESKDHVIVPSSPLVPQGDPTLLFTTAGMVQMKPYFMQEATPPKPRLTSSQKVFRTTDIEQVGNLKHLTFFEMLGNFSVGDYFKRDATAWAWEFVTRHLELPADQLWTTVYTTDDEAYECWIQLGVPPDRIVRYGEEEGNFWGPAGDTGPCGPCSEIHYDFGLAKGCGRATCGPACDCGRFLEIWNLVFMELYQDAAGHREPLPRKNIDTGMGLERTVTLLQGKQSVYDTDVFGPIIARAADLAGKRYGEDPAVDRAIRVLAEHGRAVAFLIGDGVIPSNEGRGYVLRRVLRRALRFARSLGLVIGTSAEASLLLQVVRAVIDRMGDVYPSLREHQVFIERVVVSEEAKFARTLELGLTRLDELIATAGAGGARTLGGEEVFRLYDTYGFPVELTAEIAEERGLTIDRAGFNAALARQRELARQAAKFGGTERAPVEVYHELNAPKVEFLGYQTVAATSRVTGLIVGGEPVDRLEAGLEAGEVVLAATPFYAESGGQVGDTGWIVSPAGRFEVVETTRPVPDLVVHHGKLVEGSIGLNEEVQAEVDVHRRLATGRNHTATHLLHAALRRVLGGHVQQAGSLVAPDRLRFDFSHVGAVTSDELDAIQDLVNQQILANRSVRTTVTTYPEAVAAGAIAMFDEKYGDTVRLVQVGGAEARSDEPHWLLTAQSEEAPFSRELCGGTHVYATGDIGPVVITGESSVGAGLRRIEAVTGRAAEALLESYRDRVSDLAKRLQTPPDRLAERVEALVAELAEQKRQITALRRGTAKNTLEDLLDQARPFDGFKLLTARVEAEKPDDLREMADWLRQKLGSSVVALAAVVNEKPAFLVAITRDLIPRGLDAGQIAREVGKVAGGGGGGGKDLGQSGGRDARKIDEALARVSDLVAEK